MEYTKPWNDVNLSFWKGFSTELYNEGRNTGFRHSVATFEEWDKTHAYQMSSDSDSEYENKALNETNKDDKDNKTQEDLLRTTQLVYSYQAGKMVPKLREPRQLYAVNSKELGAQQAARWPAEIQVLEEPVKHISYIPPFPEPYYQKTGLEKTPLVRSGPDSQFENRIVYEYEPVVGSFFMRSRVGGSRTGCADVSVKLSGEKDRTLMFESRFESGNLARAVQVGDYDYELWLRNDLYTSKHTQWFYFRLSNTTPDVTYRFTIVNLMKPDSLYNHGMKPLLYSEKEAKQNKKGWYRDGSNIIYYKNNLRYTTRNVEKNYYSLTWNCQFSHKDDTCYFAHCYPYTYTDLQDYLHDIASCPIKSKICKQRVLCRTLAGNLVYQLTITSPSKTVEDAKHKKFVVVTSRVHPGETNASWMMKGFIDYLIGSSADAKLLRDTFIFKIVPMLNPDGVIVGNYRCSLAGRDLNRNYKTMLKESFPSVWHTKSMIKKLLEEREIIVYCDLHGHSRKHNVFIYGCENRGNVQRRLRERIFPVMLSRNAPDQFDFNGCKFKVQKSKEGTGRIVMWNMGIMNSYTMEATFCGSSLGKRKGYHFSTYEFEAMGFHFCDTLLDYCDPDNSKSANILLELEEQLKTEIIQRLQQQGEKMEEKELNLDQEYASDIESSDGGSDSSISDGLPVHLQYLADKMPKKKKRLKTKKERDLQYKKTEESKKISVTPQATSTQDPLVNNNNVNINNNNNYSNNNTKLQSELQPVSTPVQHLPNRQKTTRSGSNNGRRTKEERSGSNGGGSGIPTFVQERVEERTQRKNDSYLEALTNAYLRSGVLTPSEPPKELPHFRYTGINRPMPHIPVNLDGLCPHHEKAFAAQYVSNHLQHFSYPDDLEEIPQYKYTMKKSGSGRSDMRSPHSERRPGSQRHIVEISAAQQRHQDLMNQEHRKHSGVERAMTGSPIKQHPPPFDQALDRDKPHDYVRPRASNSAMSAGSAKSRISSATSHHSRARSARSHINAEENLGTMPGIPGPLLVNGTDNVPEALPQSGRLHKSASVNTMDSVSSAKTSRKQISPNAEISNTLEDIKEIRTSLRDSTQRGNFSPTTGKYINDIVKQAEDEIDALTAEIQGDLQKEEKIATDFQQERREFSTSNGKKSRSNFSAREDSRNLSNNAVGNHANFHSTSHSNQNYIPSASQQVLTRKSIKFRGQYTDEEIDERIRQSQSKINMDELAKRLSGIESTDSGKDDWEDEGRSTKLPNNTHENNLSMRQNERGKSPKGQRQIASPTKISLMISRGHQDQEQKGKQFYPSGARPNNRPPLLRNVSNFPRRK